MRIYPRYKDSLSFLDQEKNLRYFSFLRTNGYIYFCNRDLHDKGLLFEIENMIEDFNIR